MEELMCNIKIDKKVEFVDGERIISISPSKLSLKMEMLLKSIKKYCHHLKCWKS